MRRFLVMLAAAVLSLATSASAVLAAPPGETQTVFIVREALDFGSGSCSGEEVQFSGWYHAVIRARFTEEAVTGWTINDTESNWGTGTGLESGDSYVRVYRSSSFANYGLQDGEGLVLQVTYLTKIIRLGPGGPSDDYLVRFVFHYTLTPTGVELTVEHIEEGCVGPS